MRARASRTFCTVLVSDRSCILLYLCKVRVCDSRWSLSNSSSHLNDFWCFTLICGLCFLIIKNQLCKSNFCMTGSALVHRRHEEMYWERAFVRSMQPWTSICKPSICWYLSEQMCLRSIGGMLLLCTVSGPSFAAQYSSDRQAGRQAGRDIDRSRQAGRQACIQASRQAEI